MISGFRRGLNEISALLRFYAALNGGLLPTFRDKLSVPCSSCSEASVRNNHSTLRKIPKDQGSLTLFEIDVRRLKVK